MTDSNDDWGLPAPGEGDGSGFDVFDAGGIDTSKLGNVRKIDKAGFYHLGITASARPARYEMLNGQLDYTKPRKPDILCTCPVLESAAGLSPVGSVHYHNITLGGLGQGAPIEERDKKATVEFLYGLGILEKRGDKIIDPQTGTEQINPNTLVDRINAVTQFIGKINREAPYARRDGTMSDESYRFSFGKGAYKLDDPAVFDIPKSAEALRKIGKEHLLNPKGHVAPPPGPPNVNPGKKPDEVKQPASTIPADL